MSDIVVIVVPSTRRMNEPLSSAEAKAYVQKTKRFLAQKFGGATAIQGEGAWIASDGSMIEESITQVYALTASLSDGDKAEVIQYCEQLRNELEQGAVMAIMNGELYLV